MSNQSGVPDQNFKPSTIIWDNANSKTFAQEGNKDLGVAYVQILDNGGSPIVSFGGGTQYTDGGIPPAHPIGSTIEWSDGTNWQTVSTAKPLPVTASINTTGLATSTGQSTGNTSLATIATNTGNIPAQGQAIAAASLPVVLPSAQITTLTPPAAITNFANETGGNLAAIKADVDKIPSLGQALAAASVPVVLTAAQLATLTPPAQGLTDTQLRATAVPVSLASVPSHAVTNAGTFTVQNNAATPAGTNLIGQVAASNETATVYNGTAALTPKFATIVASSSGATTVVAAVSLKKIRVLSYVFQCNAAVNVKFQSHVTPTDKTGLFYNAANTGVSAAYSPVGHFETVVGEALDINLSGAVAVGGHLTYIEV